MFLTTALRCGDNGISVLVPRLFRDNAFATSTLVNAPPRSYWK